MPYIIQSRRDTLENPDEVPMTPGELNYAITAVVMKYVRENSKRRGLTYTVINDVVGALEGAKSEFYRRVAAPYEDQKRAENGDVY